MSPPVECRTAHPDEFDAIARVWRESAQTAEGAPPEIASVEDLRMRIDVELASGWTLFVAAADRRIVGLLALRTVERVLDQLYVLPSSRREGIGTLLLERAMAEMPHGFTLRTASANAAARRFYERRGLELLSQGAHPRNGYPVCFYGWNLRP
jgi:putative acetyltransferase